MSTPARFSDGQYKNWLKCSQSLIIMKEALHDYIDNRVKNLHSDITQKVSSILCGSSTGNQCGSCSWKNIKLTGANPRTWSINCKNSICDKWLNQILAVHDDPHNPTINWKNADLSKWPTDCYQVAKIFMPKGQDKTTNMPEDFDAPAILSLMKYCNWFRKDLSNTQILSDLIDIRNKVLHSGDLRVADSDKDSWIDLMIQLLSDLKISGDAQAELQELKREDIDIKFRENEMRVFQRMVNGLTCEITTLKEDMGSLQDNTETTTKVDTIEADVKEMMKSLHELRNISDKMVSFLDKNPDILDIQVTETIRNVCRDVQDQQTNLLRVETEQKALAARLSTLEMNMENIQKETKKQFGGGERGHDTDEQLSLQASEYSRKKRPETESLKQLKNQTEDRLGTLAKLQYIPTKQAEKAKELLERNRAIVIRGNPGEGKTTIALHLIDNEMYRYRRVVLHLPQEWKSVDTDWVDIVILDDMLGRFELDSGHLQEWMDYLPTIQEHIDAGKLRVIITTRDDILSKALSKLASLKLFSDDMSVMLSSKELIDSEKISILNRQLQRHGKNMKEDEKETCIANFSGLIGFPQCCSIFAGDSKLFDGGPQFFTSPKKFFVSNIIKLEDTRFLSLAFLFCNDNLLQENLSPESISKSSKNVLNELASYLNISEEKASITLLRDAYDSVLDLYVVKSRLYDSESGLACICFTHATVKEAVGQVLGGRCPEMIVKYGDSEYLYQKTYTAKDKDNTSENVFIPVSVYGLLAERIVQDVVKKRLVRSIVKHSALKQHDILMKIKMELQKGNGIKDFFMAKTHSFHNNLLKGECETFMQCLLQSDEDVVRLVYSDLLELLACTHNNNSSDCWQCEEKQKLLELALYYHHFEIVDKLITMKASYTPVSLCNAARHDNFERVQSILESLKSNKVFSPNCVEAKDTLCRAYLSGMQRLIELLLKEGIVLDTYHVAVVVKHGDLNVLMKVVEHLKCHNRWKSSMEIHSLSYCLKATSLFSETYFQSYNALAIAYCDEKFDIADYLLENQVKVSLYTLADVSKKGSQTAVARVIQKLKDSDNWDPKCSGLSEIVQTAYSEEKHDVYDLLVKEGVSLTMKNLHGIINKQKLFMRCQVSLETVKKVMQYLKDTGNWDPKCDDASKTLEYAYCNNRFDLCDLLVQEQISLSLKNLPGVMESASSECIKKTIQHLKDTDSWDAKCNDASKVLEKAYIHQKYDVCDQLFQDGVLLIMENLPGVVKSLSLETIKNILQHLKETDRWYPKCVDAYKALNNAYWGQKFDVCDLLVQEGVTPTMRNFQVVIDHYVSNYYEVSLQTLKHAVQHLKDRGSWNPNYFNASKALAHAYARSNCNMCDMLVQEGVSPRMKNLRDVIKTFNVSMKIVMKTIQHLKDACNCEPKCDYASKALNNAYRDEKYDICDLLVKEGITPTMKNLLVVTMGNEVSLKIVKKIMQHLKYMKNWNSKCDDASNALANAYSKEMYYVCNLLVQEGVSLRMEHLPRITANGVSLESIKKAIQHLKDTHNWNPKCDDASKALEIASAGHSDQKNDVCYLLLQEGVAPRMSIFPDLILTFGVSLEHVRKAIQDLKDTDRWDSKCNHASKALSDAYSHQKYDMCDLLVQEGVSLRMEHLKDIQKGAYVSMETIKKIVQHLKDAHKWDPKCDDASTALENAYINKSYDVCDLLIEKGVSLTIKNLPGITKDHRELFRSSVKGSLESVKKAIQHLKDTHNWDHKCDDASKALEDAYIKDNYVVCDLLIKEGVSLTMKNLPGITGKYNVSLESVKKAIQHLKDTQNWNPKCDDASEALENAYARYSNQKKDVCYLLLQEGVSPRMWIFPDMINTSGVSLECVQKAIKYLKDTHDWDSKCNHASKALSNAYSNQNYDMCDLLVQEGVSLRMEHLKVIHKGAYVSMETIKKIVQHLKDAHKWDPKCDDASIALENAYINKRYDVCDLLIEKGVSLTIKNLRGITKDHRELFRSSVEGSLESVKKAILHLKDTHNWVPKCDDASTALENAYINKSYDVCDLLIEKGVSLTIKNLPGITKDHRELFRSSVKGSLESVKKAIQHLKDTHNWDHKCDDASKALEDAYIKDNYVVCDLLIKEGVSLTMKNLPGITGKYNVSLESVKKVIQYLKDTQNWNPKCDDASEALEIASAAHSDQKKDVCYLLLQEGVSPRMRIFPDMINTSGVSLVFVQKAIKYLKDTHDWDSKCNHASKALSNAYSHQNYDVCDLLIKEGVSLTIKNFPGITNAYNVSLESVKKAVQHLKDTKNWDPTNYDVSKALENAYITDSYVVCDLLIQEGVSLTMKNLPGITKAFHVSLKSVTKAIQHLKDTHNWVPKCDDASKTLENALANAFIHDRRVCDLLIKEGVSLTMKNLPGITEAFNVSLESVTKAIQHLKDTRNWDPKCYDASKALENALENTYSNDKSVVCDLLIQERVSLTMKMRMTNIGMKIIIGVIDWFLR